MHMIDMSNNRANIAYREEETPWHGLGVPKKAGESLDQWREDAGLIWTAEKAEIIFRNATQKDDQGRGAICRGESRIIYRSDTGTELGICTDRYKIVQPETIVEFFRDLTEENGMEMETLGSLDGGRRIWALARTGEEFRLMGQDEVKAYVLLATSYDGSMATIGKYTSTRVVCHNTLSVAVGQNAKGDIKIPHSTEFNGHQVKLDMGLLKGQWSEFQSNAQQLAERKVSAREQVDFILALMTDEKEKLDPESISTRKRNIIADILNRAQGAAKGAHFKAADGTAWGLLNAVTEYVDHTQGNSVATRFNSAQFGAGAALKREAFEAALKLAA